MMIISPKIVQSHSVCSGGKSACIELLCHYSGNRSSPSSASLNSSSSAGLCLAAVLGRSGRSPSGSV